MKLIKYVAAGLSTTFMVSLFFTSCQKLDRPELGEIIMDPTPPPYNTLKSFWSFENNLTDGGENKLSSTPKNVTYVPGVTGQAAKIGVDGYILLKTIGDTVRYPNEFVALPADTIRNLGSFSLAFWMNATGPFTDGAQGVFAISHKTQFWGNLEVFLENYNNASDQTEAFIKVHMYNAGVASGNGEEWTEVKIPGIFNKWSHIAITYDAATSKLTIYGNGVPSAINGKVLGGGNYGKIKFNDFNGMVLGSFAFQTTPSLTNHGPEGWAKSLNGSLDQFRIYTKALTQAEITDLYTTKK